MRANTIIEDESRVVESRGEEKNERGEKQRRGDAPPPPAAFNGQIRDNRSKMETVSRVESRDPSVPK